MKYILLCILGFSVVFATEGDPVTIIKKKDIELKKVLATKKSAEHTAKVKYLINDIFDFNSLGEKSISTSVWKQQSPEKQQEFIREFKRMVENSSVKKLEVYESDSTIYEPSSIKDDKAKVTAHVWSKGQESILVYRLSLINGVWRAYDLIIDDLSTVRNYREQFDDILKDKSFDELIQKVKTKADES
jgi:phospholipid transport system substrate-binding protein